MREIIAQNRSASLSPLPTLPPLQLHELSVSAAGPYALIKVSARNDGGALQRVAEAVTRLGLDVAHAQINTFENSVADTFFVTDARGEPPKIEAHSALAERLRALLSD